MLKNSFRGGECKTPRHYSRPRQRDTRGQRLEKISAVAGREFVLHSIAGGWQLTRSLGGEIATSAHDPSDTVIVLYRGHSEPREQTLRGNGSVRNQSRLAMIRISSSVPGVINSLIPTAVHVG
jgi:hypothetical protein